MIGLILETMDAIASERLKAVGEAAQIVIDNRFIDIVLINQRTDEGEMVLPKIGRNIEVLSVEAVRQGKGCSSTTKALLFIESVH